jgi:hypothetical protein
LFLELKKNMSLQIITNVIRLVIVIMAFECISAAFTPVTPANSIKVSAYKKSSAPSLFTSICFEKAEEEERSEEKSDKLASVILVDFSRVAFELSNVHTTDIPDISLIQPFNVERSLFRLFCTFII